MNQKPITKKLTGMAAIDINEAGAVNDLKSQKSKDPAAVALGRKGGLKGGKARANKLTAERRKEIAKKAAKSRWEKELNY